MTSTKLVAVDVSLLSIALTKTVAVDVHVCVINPYRWWQLMYGGKRCHKTPTMTSCYRRHLMYDPVAVDVKSGGS
jgi:hypothetical protein